MGAFTIAVYKLLMLASGSNLIASFTAILAAVLVYFVSIFMTKAISREEIELIPKGDLIYDFAVKLKIAK